MSGLQHDAGAAQERLHLVRLLQAATLCNAVAIAVVIAIVLAVWLPVVAPVFHTPLTAILAGIYYLLLISGFAPVTWTGYVAGLTAMLIIHSRGDGRLSCASWWAVGSYVGPIAGGLLLLRLANGTHAVFVLRCCVALLLLAPAWYAVCAIVVPFLRGQAPWRTALFVASVPVVVLIVALVGQVVWLTFRIGPS